MATPIHHYSDQEATTAIEKGSVLIDFYADWCGPCKMLAPVLERVAARAPAGVTIGKINVDQQRELAAACQVSSIPTLVLFHRGRVVAQTSGLQSEESLLRLLHQHQPSTLVEV